MLRTILKPPARIKNIRTVVKPSAQFCGLQPTLKLSRWIQNHQSKKMRFQNHRHGQLRSCPYPIWHPNQFVAVLVCEDQEMHRTHTSDPHVNENPVVSTALYSASSTTAAIWTHVNLADTTKNGGQVQLQS